MAAHRPVFDRRTPVKEAGVPVVTKFRGAGPIPGAGGGPAALLTSA